MMLVAMLGGRDSRSPFVRLMLIICVITGRRPGDYLPPAIGGQGIRTGSSARVTRAGRNTNQMKGTADDA